MNLRMREKTAFLCGFFNIHLSFYPSIPLFVGATGRMFGTILTYRLMAQTTCFRNTRCLLVYRWRWYTLTFRGSNPAPPPKKKHFRGMNRRFQAKHAKKYYNVHIVETTVSISTNFCRSDRDHQVLYMGGPNVPITNPIWRTVATLKNRKMAKDRLRFKRFRQNLARWFSSTLFNVPSVRNLEISRWRRTPLENGKNRHI